MQIGMEQKAKQVEKMLRDLKPTVKSLNLAVATQERVEQAEAEKQQREMEALQKAADENELKKEMYKADREAEVGRYRADREHEVQMRKLELEGQREAGRADIAARSAEADRTRKDAEAAAKISREEQMAKAKANAASAVNRMNAVSDVTGFNPTEPADIIGSGYDTSL